MVKDLVKGCECHMDEYIKLLNQDYELVRYHIKDMVVVFLYTIQQKRTGMSILRLKKQTCSFIISEGDSGSANPR